MRAVEESAAVMGQLATAQGREDPYPHYAWLRRHAPAAVAADGTIVLTRYADCVAVLRGRAFAHRSAEQMTAALGPGWERHLGLRQMFASMLALNPPDHTRLRRLVAGAFTPRRVDELHTAVAGLVDQHVEGMRQAVTGGEVDLVATLAFPLPVAVIGELLGVPPADRARFQDLVRDSTGVLEEITPRVLVRANRAASQIRGYLAALVAERRRRPAGDLLSALASAEAAGDRLSEDELLTTAALLFMAGFETTTHLIGNGVVALARHPRQRHRWHDDRALDVPAVEELLRFDSPVQSARRVTVADVDVGGTTVPGGSAVIAYLGAGNRDPDRFAEPDRLDLGRDMGAAGPLSFGGGIHYCLGAPLARLEARLVFRALLDRFPGLELAGEPARRDSLTLRGYTAIPVRLGG